MYFLVPKPSLNFSCLSLFDPDSMYYNVTAHFRVSPNNCLVLGHITTYVLKLYKYREDFGPGQRVGLQLDQKDIEIVRPF